MAKLDGLIRYHKHQLDELRKELGSLNALLDEIEADIQALEEQKDQESKLIDGDPLLGAAYTNFLQSYKAKKKSLEKAQNNMLGKIEAATIKVQDQFAELKKYEILERKRKEAEKLAAQKREDSLLDEIGIEGHRRKGED